MMYRRPFLLATCIAALNAACKNQPFFDHIKKNESVLVIGAGMAGLAAARKLHDLGYSVIVLEAKNRIGGRVWTSYLWPESPIDLGASWIHGVKKNPLTMLADEIGATRVATDYDNAVLYGTDGKVVSDDVEEDITRNFNKLIRAAYRRASEGESIYEALQTLPLWGKLSQSQKRVAMHLMNTTIEHELAGSINAISFAGEDDIEEFSGEDVIFPGGYSAVTDYLAKGLDIRLEHVVDKIAYSNEKVFVQVDQAEFLADRVIVTLPIGVLKQNSVQFVPALPIEKQKSIGVIGAGLLDKLFLSFPYVFWDKEAEILNWISREHGRWNEWLNIAAYTGQPILLGFNAADYAWKIESWSDKEIVADAMSVLQTIYGNDIPAPQSWQVTRWGNDPFAQCAYSFNAVGANASSRITLAQTIDNRLFFAGEATSKNYPATVHGAYYSGMDAANKIAEL